MNEDDPIPRSPLNTFGYYHAGHLIQLEKDKTLFYYEQNGEGDYEGAPRLWSCKLLLFVARAIFLLKIQPINFISFLLIFYSLRWSKSFRSLYN